MRIAPNPRLPKSDLWKMTEHEKKDGGYAQDILSRHRPVFPGYGHGWRSAWSLNAKAGVISHMKWFWKCDLDFEFSFIDVAGFQPRMACKQIKVIESLPSLSNKKIQIGKYEMSMTADTRWSHTSMDQQWTFFELELPHIRPSLGDPTCIPCIVIHLTSHISPAPTKATNATKKKKN
jgi:hypothetical protein